MSRSQTTTDDGTVLASSLTPVAPSEDGNTANLPAISLAMSDRAQARLYDGDPRPVSDSGGNHVITLKVKVTDRELDDGIGRGINSNSNSGRLNLGYREVMYLQLQTPWLHRFLSRTLPDDREISDQ